MVLYVMSITLLAQIAVHTAHTAVPPVFENPLFS